MASAPAAGLQEPPPGAAATRLGRRRLEALMEWCFASAAAAKSGTDGPPDQQAAVRNARRPLCQPCLRSGSLLWPSHAAMPQGRGKWWLRLPALRLPVRFRRRGASPLLRLAPTRPPIEKATHSSSTGPREASDEPRRDRLDDRSLVWPLPVPRSERRRLKPARAAFGAPARPGQHFDGRASGFRSGARRNVRRASKQSWNVIRASSGSTCSRSSGGR